MPMGRQGRLRKRLQEAVDAVFDGNVSAAAEGLGLSQPTLHKILSGKTKESKPSTVAHIADRLGVSEAWLRGERDPDIDDVQHPAGFQVGPGLLLLARYFRRKSRDYNDWLAGVEPRTEPGAKILEAYTRWSREAFTAESDLIREAAFGAVAAQMEAGAKSPGFIPEHLRAIRQLENGRVAVMELTVSALKRLREGPGQADKPKGSLG
jgi:transcriptional regulator with XRE-family HTH domain